VSGSGLPLPAARGGGDQTVAFAAELIERSGKAPVTTMHVSPSPAFRRVSLIREAGR
jgi:hypothetical protein